MRYTVIYAHLQKNIWGRTGFDRMFGESRLRVRALFSVINEQNKLSANNTTKADFAGLVAAREARTSAAATLAA